jgi:hypothetical protein
VKQHCIASEQTEVSFDVLVDLAINLSMADADSGNMFNDTGLAAFAGKGFGKGKGKGKGIVKACFTCGDKDHMANNCPNGYWAKSQAPEVDPLKLGNGSGRFQ